MPPFLSKKRLKLFPFLGFCILSPVVLNPLSAILRGGNGRSPLEAYNVRVIRFELMISIWKTEVIPLNYTRYIYTFIYIMPFTISFIRMRSASECGLDWRDNRKWLKYYLLNIILDSNQYLYAPKANAFPVQLMMLSI